nr:DNA-directed RNA polymerase II largest chain [Cryptomonas paramecium]
MIEEKKINSIQFSILSPDEIKKYSVANIETDLISEENLPKKGGLMDTRLGVIEQGYYCETDMASHIECPGHFGHITLKKPIFHEGFIEFVLLIIRCIDHMSSNLIFNQNSQRVKNVMKIKNPYQRLVNIAKLCVSSSGYRAFDKNNPIILRQTLIQPKYYRDGWCIVAKFDPKITSEPTRILSAERIYEIFKQISDQDCDKIGLNPKLARPDWMILTVLPVPPPSIRPSIIFDSTSRAEDDLTYKLSDIIRCNKSLSHLIISYAPLQLINEQINLLQYHIGSYMDNTTPNLAKSIQKTGRPIKSIRQRLQGKEGRIRGNLMGKRVDFSARTVITPDPNILLEEIGIPWSVALNLTYPEIVTSFNYEYMKQLIQNGPARYPGAKYVIKNDGTRLDLRYVKKPSNIHLEIGYQVERHLRDGDVILFNRQPSLHKMSMMSHIVKIMDYSTFRMNLSATTPYNADFDGDEMNLHLPQTLESTSELLNLLTVSKCILSQQSNKPVIGIVQDSLIGAFLLTQKDVFMDICTLNTLLIHIDGCNSTPFPTFIKPSILWTGKQVFSLILPSINLTRNCINYSDSETNFSQDNKVIILNGQLICGVIDKRSAGSSSGGIIHVCWKEYGPEKTAFFISQFQWIINHWLLLCGFSVGVEDTIANKVISLKVVSIIKKAKNEVRYILRKKATSVEIYPDKNSDEIFECQINKILNTARDQAGSVVQRLLSDKNNIKQMVISGSKGNFINISQIIACVGQQNVNGKRIDSAFELRCLPHFFFDDNGPETKGFVQNSYSSGLNPDEFFFHAMGGREGLIDTAIKTSETGYIQRRLSKIMEDIIVEYDLTVRNAQKEILEFFYGEDSIDAIFLENQPLNFVNITYEELKISYKMDVKSPCYGLNTRGDFLLKLNLKQFFEKLEKQLDCEFLQLTRDRQILQQVFSGGIEINLFLPVNIQRLIMNANNFFKDNETSTLLFPLDIINSIKCMEKFLLNTLHRHRKNCKKNCMCCECLSIFNATLFLRMYLRIIFASKSVIYKHKFTKEKFSWILNEICLYYRKSIIAPGEMVGMISSQSIGQPATQMTLNTFHYAGVSAKNVTLGIPRLKEIINVLKVTKTPSLTVYVKKEYNFSYEKVKYLQQFLEFVTLKDMMSSVSFFYDPDPFLTVCSSDRDVMKQYFEISDQVLEITHIGTWVMRIILYKNKFIDKNLSLNQIIEKIKRKIKPLVLFSLSSDENNIPNLIRFKVFWPDNKWKKKNLKQHQLYTFDYSSLEIQYLKKMSFLMTNINLKDHGTSSIKKIFIQKTNISNMIIKNDQLVNSSEFILDTEGIDLKYVLNCSIVDSTRTVSNDILETFRVFGIEAARKILIKEIKNLISFDGSYVNFRHIFLLADIMTHGGKLMSITRHGIGKTEIGPIAKSSFEETVDIFYQSAVFGIYDDIKGVSANIMVGNLLSVGTGKIDLFVDDF